MWDKFLYKLVNLIRFRWYTFKTDTFITCCHIFVADYMCHARGSWFRPPTQSSKVWRSLAVNYFCSNLDIGQFLVLICAYSTVSKVGIHVQWIYISESMLANHSKAPVTPNGDATAIVQRSENMSTRCGVAAKYM